MMSGERVLIVDDEPSIVQACHRILVGHGFQARGVVNPLTGLEHLKRIPFDLALIDVQMPGMDGLTLLKAALEVDPDLCVLMISGYSTLNQVIQASQLGAEGFVLKPFTPEELLLPIHWAISRRAARNRRIRLQAHLPLMDFNRIAISELEPGPVAAQALEIARWETKMSHAALVETRKADAPWQVLASMGSPPLTEELQKRLDDWQAEDYSSPLLLDAEGRPVTQATEAAIVCTPLQVRDELLGWLILAGPAPERPLQQDDLMFLTILSGQTAIALKNAGLYAEVQAARQRWEATFDAITDGISIHSQDHTILQVNQAMARILNTTPQNLIGQTCYPFFHDSDSPADGCPLMRTIETRRPQTTEIQSPSLGDGIYRASTYPLLDEQGEVKGVVHILKNITEEKKLQAQLVQTEKLAALGRLTASLAHEINNPLQALRSGLRLLLHRPLSKAKRQQYLTIADQEVERLIGIVERMLNFYRPNGSDHQPTVINSVVEEVLALVDKQLQHSHVNLSRDLAPDLPQVKAAADQLKQVFLNLILNAIEAMPDGGDLEVTTCFVAAKNEVQVRFTDTGQGIPPEAMNRLFEPFYTSKAQGTGLGLSISYGIIEQHNGRIEVSSRLGEGSTFTVCLPVGG